MFDIPDKFHGLIILTIYLLLLYLAFYLIVPLLTWWRMKADASPVLRELDFDDLDRHSEAFLLDQTESLLQLGFGEPAYVHIPKPTQNVSTFMIMMLNRDTGDKAMVTVMVSSIKTVHYIEFSTRFESGEVFDTHNIPELLAFPPAPLAVRTQVPMVVDPQELYELHTFVMRKFDIRAKKFLYSPGKALDYLIRYAFVKSYDNQVDRGWLYYDEGIDCYRPTLLGAYLITWGLLQPIKLFRNMAMQRRAMKILEEIDHACESDEDDHET